MAWESSTRCSIIGYVVYFDRSLVSWCSKKQINIARWSKILCSSLCCSWTFTGYFSFFVSFISHSSLFRKMMMNVNTLQTHWHSSSFCSGIGSSMGHQSLILANVFTKRMAKLITVSIGWWQVVFFPISTMLTLRRIRFS